MVDHIQNYRCCAISFAVYLFIGISVILTTNLLVHYTIQIPAGEKIHYENCTQVSCDTVYTRSGPITTAIYQFPDIDKTITYEYHRQFCSDLSNPMQCYYSTDDPMNTAGLGTYNNSYFGFYFGFNMSFTLLFFVCIIPYAGNQGFANIYIMFESCIYSRINKKKSIQEQEQKQKQDVTLSTV